jgi:DNA polymerase-3 subunit chi
MGHRVHIHNDTVELVKQLDDLLWTFRDRSFIPHEIATERAAQTTVTLSHEWAPEQCDVLVNLATDVPEFFTRFVRVAEIIDQDEHRRESGRKRFRHYRDQGYTPNHHRLES